MTALSTNGLSWPAATDGTSGLTALSPRTSFPVPQASGPLIAIQKAGLELVVAPECGARIVSFRAGGRDVLRPTSQLGLTKGLHYEYAGFPLLPYSGPVFGGGFHYDGQWFDLKRNVAQEPTATHGEAWIRPWRIVAQDDARLQLELDYKPGPEEFPFSWRGELDFRLEDDELVIGIGLTCQDERAMPAGIGFHPYFPKRSETYLRFNATGVWPADSPDAVMQPSKKIPPGLDFGAWQDISAMVIDRCYEGWDGTAELSYAGGLRTLIKAEGALTKLQIYDPWYHPYICVEPVSNANDGLNRLAHQVPGHGMKILEPGGTLRGSMRIAAG